MWCKIRLSEKGQQKIECILWFCGIVALTLAVIFCAIGFIATVEGILSNSFTGDWTLYFVGVITLCVGAYAGIMEVLSWFECGES